MTFTLFEINFNSKITQYQINGEKTLVYFDEIGTVRGALVKQTTFSVLKLCKSLLVLNQQ